MKYLFEVHITGDETIHQHAGVKTITIESLRPDKTVLETLHMTSYVITEELDSFEDARLMATVNVCTLCSNLLEAGVKITRVKIECPPYPEAIKRSLYMESHFPYDGVSYPISKRVDKDSVLGTDRVYDRDLYNAFQKRWEGEDVEVAMLDTHVEQDDEWMGLFGLSRKLGE